MARIRSTFPGQWTDEDFVCCSFPARLLAIALRNEADDHGVFEWKPVGLKMRLMPADTVDVAELLEELVRNRQVMKYEVGGKWYGAIRNFMVWQRPKKPRGTHPVTPAVEEWVGKGRRSSDGGTEPGADDPDDGGNESGIGTEPVRNQFGTGQEKSPQREEGGGIKEEGKTPPPPSTGNLVRAREGDAAAAVVNRFLDLREERWPQDSRLPAPLSTLRTQAGQHLAAGGSVELVCEVLERGFATWKRPTPPQSMDAFRDSLTDRIAEQKRAAEPIAMPEPRRAQAQVGLSPVVHDRASRERDRLRHFKRTGAWPFNDPHPTSPQCQIARRVLAEELGQDFVDQHHALPEAAE
ncbi:MAG TPA: hypothetical protein VD860_16865 [Azospirillum sp.]|nr:hypothetical protein [Azospirillum sp.]